MLICQIFAMGCSNLSSAEAITGSVSRAVTQCEALVAGTNGVWVSQSVGAESCPRPPRPVVMSPCTSADTSLTAVDLEAEFNALRAKEFRLPKMSSSSWFLGRRGRGRCPPGVDSACRS